MVVAFPKTNIYLCTYIPLVHFDGVHALTVNIQSSHGSYGIHPYRDTWIPKTRVWKGGLLWNMAVFGIYVWFLGCTPTLQGTNISPKNGMFKMIFLFPRWDMLIPWRVHTWMTSYQPLTLYTCWRYKGFWQWEWRSRGLGPPLENVTWFKGNETYLSANICK